MKRFGPNDARRRRSAGAIEPQVEGDVQPPAASAATPTNLLNMRLRSDDDEGTNAMTMKLALLLPNAQTQVTALENGRPPPLTQSAAR